MSDEEFVQAALAHLDMLYNLARRLTSSREEAEDLVQESCMRALHAWRRSRPERTGPWFATVCLNTARSERRRRSSRPMEVLEPEAGVQVVSEDDTEAQALGRVDRERVHRALMRVSPEQREAVTLMDLCGFTAAEVGEILSVPRNTVLSRVHRGHKRLAFLLEAEGHQRDA